MGPGATGKPLSILEKIFIFHDDLSAHAISARQDSKRFTDHFPINCNDHISERFNLVTLLGASLSCLVLLFKDPGQGQRGKN